jgi:alpha-L-fucosidase
MKKITGIVFVLWMCLFTWAAAAADYYVDSANGQDSQKGDSPQQAWKTLEKVNSMVFKPGDKILFKAGTCYKGQLRPQGSGNLIDGRANAIVIDMYGDGEKPCIEAQGKYQAALYLYNVEYWEITNLEITNKGKKREINRYGVYVHIENFGKANHIQLHRLYIHDVNGSLIKKKGGGSAIRYHNSGSGVKSRFDGLLIKDCHIVRCERNAITGLGYWQRKSWHPNLNVVIRDNLIEQVPGDGIVPNSCDGALVEQNIMRDCTRLLPEGEAAAGIWPWSCDNTIIQYNEVSDHKAPWDGQGFDSDWNSRNTIIQYNYSHDNEGGFLLICNAGQEEMPRNIGNIGTIVRYNISINDGIRQQPTHIGTFSPTFHISGPCKDTRIYNNTIYINKKPPGDVDRTLLKMDNWGGQWPVDTRFSNNIFYVEDEITYDFGNAQDTVFQNNLYYGKHVNAPNDRSAVHEDPLFVDPKKGNNRARTQMGFRLGDGSPGIAAGVKIRENGNRDFSGSELLSDKRPSLGALEFNTANQSTQAKRTKPWRDAKFGLFLHWGVYSVYGGAYKGEELWSAEWIQENARIPWEEYSQTVASWNPSGFDAKQWVGYAKSAGMKYLVITARHHDGFAMYPSKASTYNLMNWTEYKGPDPLAALKKACHEEGLLFGIYYSVLEFRGSPKGFDKDDEEAVKNGFSYKTLGPKPYATDDEIAALAKKQIRELIVNYKPDILWFDGIWHDMGRWTKEDSREVEDMIRSLSPGTIINNRIGAQFPDFYTFEGTDSLPKSKLDDMWEFCWNIGCFWGYNPRHYYLPEILKTPDHYIELLVDIVSKGGNYLLNVGPDPKGNFHPVAVQYLKGIGDWVRPNGECIYGASPNPFSKEPDWGYITCKPGKLFLIIKQWPGADGKISVPALNNDFQKAYVLQDPKETLQVDVTDKEWTVHTTGTIQPNPLIVIVVEVTGIPAAK